MMADQAAVPSLDPAVETQVTSAAQVDDEGAPSNATEDVAANGALKKHPLNSEWTFWLRNTAGNSRSDWSQQQKEGFTFKTVEDFWCFMNNISSPFEGNQQNVDYSIFRSGIKPDYDTPALQPGGRIIFKLFGGNKGNKLFDTWIHVVLSLIGETFDEQGSGACAGLRLVIKRGSIKFEVWTTDKTRETMQNLTNMYIKLMSTLIEVKEAEFESFDRSVSFKTDPTTVAA